MLKQYGFLTSEEKKTVAGILLMPATRHYFVHINESMEAKKRGLGVRD